MHTKHAIVNNIRIAFDHRRDNNNNNNKQANQATQLTNEPTSQAKSICIPPNFCNEISRAADKQH